MRQGLAFVYCVVALISACKTDAPTENSPVDTPAPAPAPVTDREGIPVSTPAAEGISDSALKVLIANASAERSEGVVILRNGKVVYENYFGRIDAPIMAM